MKRKLLLAMGLLMIAVVLFAGGQRSGSGKTLTVWDFKFGEEVTGRVFGDLDRQFEQNNPGVTINHVAQPETDYYPLLTNAFRAKNNVDVVMIHPDNRAWNLADFFEVLDPYIANVKG